jgi:hypothetical protein
VFCGELSKIETIGPCSRLIFSVPQQSLFSDGTNERIVVAKIVLPTNILASMAESLLARRVAEEIVPLAATLN